MKRVLCGFLLGLLCFVGGLGPAAAQRETITDFQSDIVIGRDGGLTVTETITAIAAGDNIKHGIYRDFPTSYPGPLGLRETVGFELVSAKRDGRFEPTTTKPRDNGVRIYLGDPGRFVPHGPHTWTIVYRTTRQLRFLDKVDELYWNVTGNGWAFPIENVTARVELPGGARLVEGTGYTGYSGASGDDWRLTTDDLGMPVFTTTRTLQPAEGLTIAVSWPKGFVAEPSSADTLAALYADNRGLMAGFGAFIVVIVYFVVMWLRVGRDPAKGVVFPRFEAPDGRSAVGTGFVANNGFGSRFSSADAFAVALTSLAIKGALTLDERSGEVVVERTSETSPKNLPPGEASVLRTLFAGGKRAVLDGSYDKKIEKAVGTLRAVAKREYTDDYIRSNLLVWLPGALIAVAGAVAAVALDAPDADSIPMTFFLMLFALAFGTASFKLARNALPAFGFGAGSIRSASAASFGDIVPALIFAVPVFIVFGIMNLFVSLPTIVIAVLLLGTTALFMYLLRAPTMRGRAALDAIEGYRLYLSVAEEDRMAMAAHEPRMTVAQFETHLPYAMALGVADAWTQKFVSRIDLTAPGAPRSINDYRPRWYVGSDRFGGVSGLTDHLSSSLSGTISSAATAPSSSSSSGSSFSSGGGSSGGGGGGGGGGGW